jgi:hypothetical protein
VAAIHTAICFVLVRIEGAVGISTLLSSLIREGRFSGR